MPRGYDDIYVHACIVTIYYHEKTDRGVRNSAWWLEKKYYFERVQRTSSKSFIFQRTGRGCTTLVTSSVYLVINVRIRYIVGITFRQQNGNTIYVNEPSHNCHHVQWGPWLSNAPRLTYGPRWRWSCRFCRCTSHLKAETIFPILQVNSFHVINSVKPNLHILTTYTRDNSGVRYMRHGASFSKVAHRNLCDAP